MRSAQKAFDKRLLTSEPKLREVFGKLQAKSPALQVSRSEQLAARHGKPPLGMR
ncbi:hypothetical protein [Streptomyces avermitilis]|uniref:hypothetical protein n=1 Tax=Streptomyces avermitilis TaxID=33903 RepID=UPI0037F93802